MNNQGFLRQSGAFLLTFILENTLDAWRFVLLNLRCQRFTWPE